jgi:hypothetical protein
VHRFLDKPQGGQGNVVFNFRGHPVEDLSAFATGYHLAGKTLATNFATKGYADYEGYPILFLYRHALELYLKAVVYQGALLLGLVAEETLDTKKLFRKHQLSLWLPHVEAIFRVQGWAFDGTGLNSFDDFEELVHSLDGIDPESYAFRYPIDSQGQPYLPRHFVLNVVSFARNMDGLLSALDGAATGLREDFQLAAEARYELRQFIDDV